MAIGTLSLLLGASVTAPAASAATGQRNCNGIYKTLCVKELSNGYQVSYYNDTGEVAHLDFNLNCSSGRYGDEGSFTSYPGWTSYYYFEVGVKTWCQGGMYDYDFGGGPGLWLWTTKLYH
ncbi:hypothetical protein OG689_40270 [Kitasatospora sp. NBC_00240]|uniref:hypothetical protein n=1 Tax=Kitasatospora sp. NBC_00240 TaxID=2903567 RepID=UPI00224DF338|nr:hypothetical protein [Kitasatospora sp. NBC_00240]MCX5215414.1 hypothetical protein [Kitasatospora sp. NBC_00240]